VILVSALVNLFRDGKEPELGKIQQKQNPGFAKNQIEPESKSKQNVQEPEPNPRNHKEPNRA